MKNISLIRIFKSAYCKLVFTLSLIVVYLLMPRKIFYGYYMILGVIFIILTSLLITCFVRNIKEKIYRYSVRNTGTSLGGIISIILGFGALEACSIGAPVCGASIGAGALSLFFPGIALSILDKYSLLIISLSLIVQGGALYLMGCFKVSHQPLISRPGGKS